MKKTRTFKHLLGLLSGLIILSFPIFFFDAFAVTWMSAYSYSIFVIIGIAISIYFFSKLIQFKVFYIFLFLIFSEIGIYSSFILTKNGVNVPSHMLANLKHLYNKRMVNIIQFDPTLSGYDNELFYKLKQGKHHYSNLEFNTNFSVNSIGARDDENSIESPKIICIGDSFTMGWGVENENMFSSIIEKTSRKKTLNLGVSSYGTAREFLFFDKINLDSCESLVIQFCENDVLENRAFVENGFVLKTSPEKNYNIGIRINFLRKSYFPFKWTFELFAKLTRSIISRTFMKTETKEIIRSNDYSYIQDFFKIVSKIQEKFSGNIIIFIPESDFTPDDYKIFPFMKKYLEDHPVDNLKILDAPSILTQKDFFHIDVHLNNQGHQKIAENILQIMATSNN